MAVGHTTKPCLQVSSFGLFEMDRRSLSLWPVQESSLGSPRCSGWSWSCWSCSLGTTAAPASLSNLKCYEEVLHLFLLGHDFCVLAVRKAQLKLQFLHADQCCACCVQLETSPRQTGSVLQRSSSSFPSLRPVFRFASNRTS